MASQPLIVPIIAQASEAARFDREWRRWDQAVSRFEEALIRVLRREYLSERRHVLRILRGSTLSDFKAATWGGTLEAADVLAKIGRFHEANKEQWAANINAVIKPTATKFTNDVMVSMSFTFPGLAPEVEKFLQTYAINLADQVNKTTMKMIKTQITAGIAAGETLDQITDRISDSYLHWSRSRPETIARTEVGKISSLTINETIKHSKLDKKNVMKIWITASDGRVRDSHRAQHRMKRKFNEPFPNGLMYPRSGGPAEEVINCRCTIAYEEVAPRKPDTTPTETDIPEQVLPPQPKMPPGAPTKKMPQPIRKVPPKTFAEKINQQIAAEWIGGEVPLASRTTSPFIRNGWVHKSARSNEVAVRKIGAQIRKEARRRAQVKLGVANKQELEAVKKWTKIRDQRLKDWTQAKIDYGALSQEARRAETLLNSATSSLKYFEQAAKKVTPTLLRDTVLEVLSEIRGFGGQLALFGDALGVSKIQDVAKYLPSDWISVMNNPIRRQTGERALKSSTKIIHKTGKEVRAGYSSVGGQGHITIHSSDRPSVALHELTHRTQDTVEHVKALENAFVQRRIAKGSGYSTRAGESWGSANIDLYGNGKEWAYKDKFTEKYSGKWQPNLGGATEVMSTGMEGVFFNKHKIWSDDDFIDFVLGVLASVP
jgi:hypothetical protein